MTATLPTTMTPVSRIQPLTADEAYDLLTTALDRMLDVLDTLDGDDWQQPTYCSEWTVRDILAHQAGGYASGTGYGELLRQYTRMPPESRRLEDAINAFQLREREGKTPAELLEELRRAGPAAAKNWAYGFKLIRFFAAPHPDAGSITIKHLNWVIHSRDTWMHRLDICHATGRDFAQTAEHDGRIVELVMLDVARTLKRKASGPALVFDLTGIAGGTWLIGEGEPAATITMDALEFNLFASGRISYDEARPSMTISGDQAAAENALRNILIVY